MLSATETEAAISFVGSCQNNVDTTPNGANATLPLPAMQQDDLVIIAYSVGDNDNVDENMAMSTAGYTEVADLFANDTQDLDLGVYWKVMGASPDTTAVVAGAGGTDASVAGVCMVFRGVDTVTPMDVTPTTATNINTMHADPPSINHNNPSGVWTVIAGASGHTLGSAGTYTFPTGYTTDAINSGSDDTSDTTVGLGYRSSSVSDPEDPGVMTHSGTDSTSFAWGAVSIALRPAVTVAPTISTDAASSVTSASAVLNGQITATGGENASVRGFAWGTSSTLSGGDTSTTTDDTGSFGVSSFTDNVSGLITGRTYYFRAYATNSAGTGFDATSPILSFTASAADSTISRKLHLFEGFILKLISGRLILFGN